MLPLSTTLTGPKPASRKPAAINALGPGILALAAAAQGLPLLHVSTDYVFDGAARRPYHEYDRPHPLSVYGASKLAGEEAIRAANAKHYIVRTAWLFWEDGGNFLLYMYGLAARAGSRWRAIKTVRRPTCRT